jgi:hypothetical protein
MEVYMSKSKTPHGTFRSVLMAVMFVITCLGLSAHAYSQQCPADWNSRTLSNAHLGSIGGYNADISFCWRWNDACELEIMLSSINDVRWPNDPTSDIGDDVVTASVVDASKDLLINYILNHIDEFPLPNPDGPCKEKNLLQPCGEGPTVVIIGNAACWAEALVPEIFPDGSTQDVWQILPCMNAVQQGITCRTRYEICYTLINGHQQYTMIEGETTYSDPNFQCPNECEVEANGGQHYQSNSVFKTCGCEVDMPDN